MPQLITKQYKVFKFEELKPEVQEKVIERHRKYRCKDYSYTEMLDEDFKQILAERGLPTDVAFSLCNCQGDGVAFYGNIDLDKFLKYNRSYKRFKKLLDNADVSAFIKRNDSHYTHSNTMSIYVEAYYDDADEYDSEFRQTISDKLKEIKGIDYKSLEHMRDELEAFIQEVIIDTSKELENIGYKYFDDIYSDDSIKEDIEANGNKFLEDGSVI